MHSHIAVMAPGKPGARRGRILVADDQPANLMLLYQLLSNEYELLAATGGEQALALCRQELPDLVLLDVVMPDVDGLEVCRRMKRDDDLAAIPVVFVTAGTSDTQENACWEAGGADFVHKPVNPNTLRRRVRSHLQLKWQFDALQALAFKDGLTGLANRRHVDERVAEEWRRCGRAAMSLAILMIDVDHFKRYNDHYGHQAGDACLMALAGALSGAINRPGDLVGRFGGEEFICVLPETDATGVGLIAGRPGGGGGGGIADAPCGLRRGPVRDGQYRRGVRHPRRRRGDHAGATGGCGAVRREIERPGAGGGR